MFCIVLADCPSGSCKRSACKCTFLKPAHRVETFENTALAVLFGQWIRILCVSMTPSPHPSTSSLRPLNPALCHNNNNNNNGGLHACVHATEDIEPIRVIRAPLPLRWTKKDYGEPHTPHHFISTAKGFLLLLSVCMQHTSFMCMLHLMFSVFGEFQAPPIGWNINYSILSCLQWIHLDANILETMPRRTGEIWLFRYVWIWPKCKCFGCFGEFNLDCYFQFISNNSFSLQKICFSIITYLHFL